MERTPDVLWHAIPRLDAPDRLWLLPAPVAKWLGAGLFSGPVCSQVLVFLTGADPAGVWSQPAVWLVWALGLVVGSIGAFIRPQGLHLGQWAAAVVGYALVPRRLVWCPIVERGKE